MDSKQGRYITIKLNKYQFMNDSSSLICNSYDYIGKLLILFVITSTITKFCIFNIATTPTPIK